jgi:PBP4 family serine-type D-alanyl-D-alanine carboxypeptidase
VSDCFIGTVTHGPELALDASANAEERADLLFGAEPFEKFNCRAKRTVHVAPSVDSRHRYAYTQSHPGYRIIRSGATEHRGEGSDMMKRLPFALAAFALIVNVAPPVSARLTPTLSGAVKAIIDRPSLKHTLFGLEVYDADAKRVIYADNGQLFMKPASTTKLMTEGATLALLGPNFQFTTPVYRTGPVDAAGVLHGDLVLVASGDPDLSGRIQPDGTMTFENEDHSYDGSPDTKAVPGDPLAVLRELAAQIAASGIKSVVGRVLVDATLFPDAGAESGTGAYVSPIVVNDNLIDTIVTPGKQAGDPVTFTVSPQTPYATFTSKAVTGAPKSDNTLTMDDTADDNGNHAVTLTGSVPASDPATLYAYRVPTPARFAAVALTLALQQAGVQIAEVPRDTPFVKSTEVASYIPANLVAQHVSPPLREDIRITLKVSDNLHASIMPYLLGVDVAHATHGKLQAGFGLEHTFLQKAGLDLSQATQSDGLGGDAYFTPDFIVHYLLFARTQSWFPDLYRGLPILGVDGTLFNIQNNAPAKGKVHAKTGSWGINDLLNNGGFVNSKGLSGFVTARNGHHIVFALYLNRMQSGHNVDGTHIAGEVLGEIANAIYLYSK